MGVCVGIFCMNCSVFLKTLKPLKQTKPPENSVKPVIRALWSVHRRVHNSGLGAAEWSIWLQLQDRVLPNTDMRRHEAERGPSVCAGAWAIHTVGRAV